ncbi:MAG: AAA family ATPase [Candidatus Lokiarchaeota archaeon]|nr:AAA family ATPase [Candidatus Lokiarchaeota archaeon]
MKVRNVMTMAENGSKIGSKVVSETRILIILCGLPSSGKSTLARRIEEKFANMFNREITSVDIDKIRIDNFGDKFLPENENRVRSIAKKDVDNYLIDEVSVIVDDINYYSSMRHEWVSLANKHRIPYFIIYINTPLETCLKWNKIRGSPIDEMLIRHIDLKFDIPGSKYKWDEPFLTYNLEEANLNTLIMEILREIYSYLQSNNTPQKDLKKSLQGKDAAEQSQIHKFDVFTRQFVTYYQITLENELQKLGDNPLLNEIHSIISNSDILSSNFRELRNKYKDDLQSLNQKRREFIHSQNKIPKKDMNTALMIKWFVKNLISGL